MHYRAEIDGLRTVAVLPVILFHAGFSQFSGGFVGVDVFFVISGYLITTIILSELNDGEFSIIKFYERRARRILPALFFVLFACLPFSWLWLAPQDMKSFSQSLIAVSGFASNILFWKTSGYFEIATELKPLLHTWSLAVEEQYYIFFPLFLLAFWRLGKRWILPMMAIVAIVSLVAAQWGSVTKPTATFYLLPTRSWELLVGAFVAFYFSSAKQKNNSFSQIGGLIGLLLLLYSILAFDKFTPFPSFYTLIPVFGAALIILCATEQTLTGKILGSKILVGIGIVSYSGYLWHQPLFAFARYKSPEEPSSLLLGSLVLAAFIMAYFSWKYIETPFRNRILFSQRSIFIVSAIGSLFFVAFGIVGHVTNGFENRLTNTEREVLAYTSDEYTNNLYKNTYRRGVCFLFQEQTFADFKDECKSIGKTNSSLIWGDSHAAALFFGLQKEITHISQYTMGGCPPIIDTAFSSSPNCKAVNDFVMAEIKRTTPREIFIHANWLLYKEQDPVQNIYKTIESIRSVNPLARVTIIGPVPQWIPSLPVVLVSKNIGLNEERSLFSPRFHELSIMDESLRRVSEKINVRYFSALSAFCKHKKCSVTIEYKGNVTMTAWDYGHLTEGGSAFLAHKLTAN